MLDSGSAEMFLVYVSSRLNAILKFYFEQCDDIELVFLKFMKGQVLLILS